MRADRLVAVLLLLQRRSRVTAAEVSRELEVSERTARRDLEALAMAGLPVYAERGRNGGWRLLGGGRTDLSGLSAPEARALFLMAGTAGAAASVTPEVRNALRKLVRALPESMRSEAERASRSIVVDAGGWGRTSRPEDRSEHLAELQDATAAGSRVRLRYRDRAGSESTRVVDPLGLVKKGRGWYLMAGTDAGPRTFRVDRITSVTTTGEPAERPPGFDLAESWREAVERIEELRAPVSLDCLVEPGLVEVLEWMFDRHLTVGDEEGGRIRVRLAGPRIEVLASQVAGFGRGVEVVGPPAARAHLAGIAFELHALYASTPT